ncbi:MAG: hypothetical protein KF775_17470 [Cyclobacteriaceae bacterium]|nr:hypothetical protein [Cyclobacteriaceae bacterium]
MKRTILLIICYSALQFYSDFFLITEDVIYDSLIDQLAYDRVSNIVAQNRSWRWISYSLVICAILIKLLIISGCFAIGNLLLNGKTHFKILFSIVSLSEFIFLIPAVIKIFWFSVVKTDYTLQDLQYFPPLSILNLFDTGLLEHWLIYPLQLLNLFELAYWCILAWQLKDILNKDFASSLGFVASTYGVGLLLWVIFVMFLTVSLT